MKHKEEDARQDYCFELAFQNHCDVPSDVRNPLKEVFQQRRVDFLQQAQLIRTLNCTHQSVF